MKTTSEIKELLLQQRGLDIASAKSFFNPQYDLDIHEPKTLTDVPAAIDRIYQAVKNGDSIIVHGDYDADGITSTAILVSVLQDLGANVTPFLPHRSDHGYGLNKDTLKGLVSEMKLLIAVDCGISNGPEISWLAEQDIDVIVVDHHASPQILPEAVAIVHPAHPAGKYAWPHLSGAGTAWKLASALLQDKRSSFRDDPDHEKWLLDLAMLGTLADRVPILGENRVIVSFGLEILRRTQRPGLQMLLAAQNKYSTPISSDDVAFNIIPVLNAAGRLDHPQPALELLLTSDVERAQTILKHLLSLNTKRQTLTRRVVAEAMAYVNDDPFIFAYDESWPAGIVGLAAGRLAERFGKPAIVVGNNGREAVGSARSPVSINILDLLRTGEKSLLKFGGHAQAAGFSLDIKRVEEFREQLLSAQTTTTGNKEIVEHEQADAVVGENLLTRDTVTLLESFAPFGQGNERPKFIVKGMQLLEWHPVGSRKDHAKFTFRHGDEALGGIGFGLVRSLPTEMKPGFVDILGELSEDEFQGRRRLQLIVRDISKAGTMHINEKSDSI